MPDNTVPDDSRQRLLTDRSEVVKVTSALASESRLSILEACSKKYRSVTELAILLGMPQSTVTNHIQQLEEADLIQVKSEAGRRGRQKLCRATGDTVSIVLRGSEADNQPAVDMPVGLFTKVHISPPCGLASPARVIGVFDFPGSFLLPERVSAGLVWFADGWVEYSFPRNFPQDADIGSLEVSFEVCSEAVNSNNDWPSDITVWINDIALGTWTSPSDYGRPRGVLNPQWWPSQQSQFGDLKSWIVTKDGTYIDGDKVSDVTPQDLNLTSQPTYLLRIGIAKNSKNRGGVNIFGSSFGNHEQDILVVVTLD